MLPIKMAKSEMSAQGLTPTLGSLLPLARLRALRAEVDKYGRGGNAATFGAE
jgi:hypothetical protein